MTDKTTTPPRHLTPPLGIFVKRPDMRLVQTVLINAGPSRSQPIPLACGAMRYFVAADGSVHDVTVLAAYPPGIGLEDALARFMATAVYPPSDAGGPYGESMVMKSKHMLMRRPDSSQ
jgi:hypothetical protein